MGLRRYHRLKVFFFIKDHGVVCIQTQMWKNNTVYVIVFYANPGSIIVVLF